VPKTLSPAHLGAEGSFGPALCQSEHTAADDRLHHDQNWQVWAFEPRVDAPRHEQVFGDPYQAPGGTRSGLLTVCDDHRCRAPGRHLPDPEAATFTEMSPLT
jgi:hypothetical protein